MDEIEVPAPFLCPISLQLMNEPVTVSTGITYERENIERWLFTCKNKICPVTKQTLLQTDLTPNHTLHRLIQSWCNHNNHASLETTTSQHVPNPKPAIDISQIAKLLSEAKRAPQEHIKECLARLRSIAFESEGNKKCLESSGAIDFLASIINKRDSVVIIEAAIEVLFHLNPSGSKLRDLINKEGIQFLEALFHVLKLGNHQSRACATLLLKSAFSAADPTQLSSVRTEQFAEITRVLRDQVSIQASKAALKLLVELSSWGRNRIKAVEGGAVSVLIELLLQVSERRACELILVALERLCGCAEGRAELLSHGAGVAAVSKKILRVSCVASDRGVKILASVCRYSATPRVLQEMVVVGAVNKLCLVLQVEGRFKAKERADGILKLHSSVWKNSSCIPLHLLSSYP